MTPEELKEGIKNPRGLIDLIFQGLQEIDGKTLKGEDAIREYMLKRLLNFHDKDLNRVVKYYQ